MAKVFVQVNNSVRRNKSFRISFQWPADFQKIRTQHGIFADAYKSSLDFAGFVIYVFQSTHTHY